MIQFYPQIKAVHVAMVVCTIALFALRGAGSLAGHKWPLWWPVRWASYAIDTTLLTAAMMLLVILPWGLFANGWLAMKVLLLVVYIVLAYMALRASRPVKVRLLLYAAALLVFAWIYSIARAHHPLGAIRGLFA